MIRVLGSRTIAKLAVGLLFTSALSTSMAVSYPSMFSDESAAAAFQSRIVAAEAERTTQAAVMKGAVAQRDAAALSSSTCSDLDQARKTQALAWYDRGRPVDPSMIIQNSTCLMDVVKIRIPVSLTGIGFLDGIISTIGNKLLSSACGALQSYITNLKNSAISQISGAVSNGTGGALNISGITSGNVSVNVGGVGVGANLNNSGSQIIDSATNQVSGQVSNRVVNEVTGQVNQAAYDAFRKSTAPAPVSAPVSVQSATKDYKQVQCSVNGVGANDSCPCPAPASLPGRTQSKYPACSDTYVPWSGAN